MNSHGCLSLFIYTAVWIDEFPNIFLEFLRLVNCFENYMQLELHRPKYTAWLYGHVVMRITQVITMHAHAPLNIISLSKSVV